MGAAALPWIIGGTAVAGMVNQNLQNKAAIKNNETQQASNLANTQAAYQTARNDLNDWIGKNPNPFQGLGVARPGGSYGTPYQPQAVNAGSVLGQQNPLQQLLQQIFQRSHAGYQTPTTGNTPWMHPGSPNIGSMLGHMLGGGSGAPAPPTPGAQVPPTMIPFNRSVQ